ncbi:MAG: glycosyltransferase family 2 protein [Streptosporangiaceae bacterium]
MTGITGSSPPLVTVITPAYNVGKYVGEAVDSVLRQSFQDFEYLVVDDESSDDTAQVARAHAAGDPRFCLISVKHGGVSAARNAGIRESRGRYIALLDGDDRWRPRFLERQVGLIESLPPDVGVVFCRVRSILENGLPIKVHWLRTGRYDFDDFVVRNNPAGHGGILVRRSCFAEVGGFDEGLPFAEDLEMWLRIAERSASPVLWASRHFLADRRLRPDAMTRDTATAEPTLDELLATQVTKLRRHLAAEAYVRPALLALKYGSDAKRAKGWADTARSAGFGRLARSAAGRQLLLWDAMPGPVRRAVRGTQERARSTVKRAVAQLHFS